MQAIGAVETKLLYTMQWILLYAAEECADEEEDMDPVLRKDMPKTENYLFSVPTITVTINNKKISFKIKYST